MECGPELAQGARGIACHSEGVQPVPERMGSHRQPSPPVCDHTGCSNAKALRSPGTK